MSDFERRKGLRGQQQVQRLFSALGFDHDKLAGQGDRVWYTPRGHSVRLEVKYQPQRTRLPAWIKQSEAETPPDMIPCVVWKHDGRWRIDMDAEDLIGLVQ